MHVDSANEHNATVDYLTIWRMFDEPLYVLHSHCSFCSSVALTHVPISWKYAQLALINRLVQPKKFVECRVITVLKDMYVGSYAAVDCDTEK